MGGGGRILAGRILASGALFLLVSAGEGQVALVNRVRVELFERLALGGGCAGEAIAIELVLLRAVELLLVPVGLPGAVVGVIVLFAVEPAGRAVEIGGMSQIIQVTEERRDLIVAEGRIAGRNERPTDLSHALQGHGSALFVVALAPSVDPAGGRPGVAEIERALAGIHARQRVCCAPGFTAGRISVFLPWT
jgi:hypothetical protein